MKIKHIPFLLLVLLCLVVLCSCGANNNSTTTTTQGTRSNTTTDVTAATEESSNGTTSATQENNNVKEPYMHDYLSYILMYKIANDYAFTCSWEFDEDDVVPYEQIFGYFMSAGCDTFDERMIEPSIRPYYNEKEFMYSIPHDIVDRFLAQHFNTVPNPNAIEYYNPENGCYEFEVLTGAINESIFVHWNYKRKLRDNVYEFTAKYIDYYSDDPVWRSTFVVELTESGHKILAHQRATEEPSEEVQVIRKLYENDRDPLSPQNGNTGD